MALELPQSKKIEPQTPATVLGLTDHVWSLPELMSSRHGLRDTLT